MSRGCGLATDQKAVRRRGPGRVVLGSKPQLATTEKLVRWAEACAIRQTTWTTLAHEARRGGTGTGRWLVACARLAHGRGVRRRGRACRRRGARRPMGVGPGRADRR